MRRSKLADTKLKKEEWAFSAGKRVTQFNKESPITPLQNSISTLFYGGNFMKTYENYFGAANTLSTSSPPHLVLKNEMCCGLFASIVAAIQKAF